MPICRFLRVLGTTIFMSSLLFLPSCGGGGGGGGSGEGLDHAPVISAVRLYNMNDPSSPVQAIEFEIWDYGNAEVEASDEDLDILKAWVWEYYPADATTPYSEGEVLLPSQTDPNMIYSLIEDFVFYPPSGGYRIEVQLEDERGNLSNIFRMYYVLE